MSFDICSLFLGAIWNEEVILNNKLKIKPKASGHNASVQKKQSTIVKKYRTVSVLSIVSKIFRQLMQNQVSKHINQF